MFIEVLAETIVYGETIARLLGILYLLLRILVEAVRIAPTECLEVSAPIPTTKEDYAPPQLVYGLYIARCTTLYIASRSG